MRYKKRGAGKSYRDALDEVFKRTGVPKEQFVITKLGKDKHGKSIPVEYSAPNGANVNMDIPEFNNVTNGVLGNGSHHHILATKMLGKALIVSEGIFLLMNYLLLGDKI